MYIAIHVTYPLFLSDVNETQVFSTDFRKILKSNFMKILPEGAELFHADERKGGQADRRTGMPKLIVAFRNFAIAPKNKKHGALAVANHNPGGRSSETVQCRLLPLDLASGSEFSTELSQISEV